MNLETNLICRIRYALGMEGHVYLDIPEVESTGYGFIIHDRCKRRYCRKLHKTKVVTDGVATEK